MADQPINELPVKTTPQTGDKVLISGASEEYLMLIDKLADAVLNKLTSKTFALEQGNMTLLAALDALNSNFKNDASKVIATLDGGSKVTADIKNGFCSISLQLHAEDVPSVEKFNAGTICKIEDEKYIPPFTMYESLLYIDKKGMYDGCYLCINKTGEIKLLTRYSRVSPDENSCLGYGHFYYPVKY